MKDGEDERGVGDEKLKSGSLEGRNGGDGSIAMEQTGCSTRPVALADSGCASACRKKIVLVLFYLLLFFVRMLMHIVIAGYLHVIVIGKPLTDARVSRIITVGL